MVVLRIVAINVLSTANEFYVQKDIKYCYTINIRNSYCRYIFLYWY